MKDNEERCQKESNRLYFCYSCIQPKITQKSVMGGVQKVFGNNLSTKDISSIQMTINEHTGNILETIPFFVSRQKVKEEIYIQFEEGKGRVVKVLPFSVSFPRKSSTFRSTSHAE